MHYGEVRVLGESDVMKGISVVGIFTFKEANCQLVVGLVMVEESCEVCVADVTIEESHDGPLGLQRRLFTATLKVGLHCFKSAA